VVPLLDKLAKRGLVERRASTTDRRHKHLHLTDAGRERVDAGARLRDAEVHAETLPRLWWGALLIVLVWLALLGGFIWWLVATVLTGA
jgi:DNA-binding PadR family transcriptional regulator